MITKALIIDEPWIDLILQGRKTWEMRSRPTKIRGPIGLIRKGSKTIVGTAVLRASLDPLTPDGMREKFAHHGVPATIFGQPGYSWLCPWVLAEVKPLARPVPYVHKSGAVIFVNLSNEESAVLARAA